MLDHCAGLCEEQRKAVAASDAAVALVPRSDPHYGLGTVTPVLATNRHGIQQAISSDNEFEYGLDLFTEMRTLMTVQRGGAFAAAQAGDADAPAPYGVRDALRAATVGGALAAGLHGEIGTLVAGAKADLTVLSLDRLRPVASHIGVASPTPRSPTSTPSWSTGSLESRVTSSSVSTALRWSATPRPAATGCSGRSGRPRGAPFLRADRSAAAVALGAAAWVFIRLRLARRRRPPGRYSLAGGNPDRRHPSHVAGDRGQVRGGSATPAAFRLDHRSCALSADPVRGVDPATKLNIPRHKEAHLV